MATTDNSSSANAESTERLRLLVEQLTDDDLRRPLGGGWTVAFALAHLAFWDARQVAALQRFAQGEPFPTEDLATNDALESIAAAFDPTTVGQSALEAAEQLDQTIKTLTAEQVEALRSSAKTYAINRAPHRNEHIQQIEESLG